MPLNGSCFIIIFALTQVALVVISIGIPSQIPVFREELDFKGEIYVDDNENICKRFAQNPMYTFVQYLLAIPLFD
jgi:hypothetical protein